MHCIYDTRPAYYVRYIIALKTCHKYSAVRILRLFDVDRRTNILEILPHEYLTLNPNPNLLRFLAIAGRHPSTIPPVGLTPH